MHYSIQHANYDISGDRIGDSKWNINVKLYDKYNFDNFRKPIYNPSNAANNLGLIMQHTRMLRPYSWEVNYSMTYMSD